MTSKSESSFLGQTVMRQLSVRVSLLKGSSTVHVFLPATGPLDTDLNLPSSWVG